VTLQRDGCRQEVLAGRNDYATAALLRTGLDGLVDGFLVLGGKVFCRFG